MIFVAIKRYQDLESNPLGLPKDHPAQCFEIEASSEEEARKKSEAFGRNLMVLGLHDYKTYKAKMDLRLPKKHLVGKPPKPQDPWKPLVVTAFILFLLGFFIFQNVHIEITSGQWLSLTVEMVKNFAHWCLGRAL